MRTLPVGLQLYSVRGEAEADFPGTLRVVREFGYDGIELAGLYGRTPLEVKQLADEAGLSVISAHVPWNDLKDNMEETLDAYALIGCSYITVPMLDESRLYGGEAYDELLMYLPNISEACRNRGMTLLYHNHDFEFKRTDKGSYVLDELFETVGDQVLKPEFDTCWVHVAGEDPVRYLQMYQGKCPLIHVKDHRPGTDAKLCALGEGVMDIPKLIDAAVTYGTEWLIVEQDDHHERTPMENVKISMDYLKSID